MFFNVERSSTDKILTSNSFTISIGWFKTVDVALVLTDYTMVRWAQINNIIQLEVFTQNLQNDLKLSNNKNPSFTFSGPTHFSVMQEP